MGDFDAMLETGIKKAVLLMEEKHGQQVSKLKEDTAEWRVKAGALNSKVRELEEEVVSADDARRQMKATCDDMQQKNVTLQLQFQVEKNKLTKTLAETEKKISASQASTTDLTDQISSLQQKVSNQSSLQSSHSLLQSSQSSLKTLYHSLLHHYTTIISKASNFEFSLQKLLSEYHDIPQVKLTSQRIQTQLLQTELDYFLDLSKPDLPTDSITRKNILSELGESVWDQTSWAEPVE